MTDLPAIVLRGRDLARSIMFYRDGLGFTLSEHLPDMDVATIIDKDGDALLLAGPRALDLASHARPDPWELKPAEPLRYACDDLDVVRARLTDNAFTNTRSTHMPWGDPALDVLDPDGYLMRFVATLHRTAEQVLALLNQGTNALDAALAGLSEHDFDLTRAPGEWTIRQIVAHLVDGDTLILLPNIKMALGESGRARVSSRWNQEIWGQALYATLDVAPSLALIRATRAYLTALLATQHDPWDRFILLRAEGAEGDGRKISVRDDLFNIATHTFEHIEEIRQTRQAHGR